MDSRARARLVDEHNSKRDSSPLHSNDPQHLRHLTGYLPIEHYGIVGNMHTVAMVAKDTAIDFMCWPDFDSPSVFCRLLDKDKGGHFTIKPKNLAIANSKQNYLPSSNILQTRFLGEEGVLDVIDFFPIPADKPIARPASAVRAESQHDGRPRQDDPQRWVVRRVECIRGTVDVELEVLPAFNYAQDKHTTIIKGSRPPSKGEAETAHDIAQFRSENLSLELIAIASSAADADRPFVNFEDISHPEGLGPAARTAFTLTEGQALSFVLRELRPRQTNIQAINSTRIRQLQVDTEKFWFRWISQSTYKGRWRAIVASPTFSLPEDIGGVRNWDYRFSWIRDSSFTIYIFLRMGFKAEAEAYMDFISDRMRFDRLKDGSLPIMFSIHGTTDLPELELTHLEGYRGSSPVRIGNGAATHKQLDIYGELMDAIYLYNKYGKPVSYDQWVAVRDMIDYVCTAWREEDMSIWEVRGKKQNFVYSKIMMWVAVDRALRLSDKRVFPCPQRLKWMSVRDEIYEDVMNRGYNQEMSAFIQSYESNTILDSAVLIAPLVFFIAPNDPRFLSTLERILKPPEKGGLTSAGLVYRYDTSSTEDGVGGREGAFSMCTFWLIEALVRAGAYDKKYLQQAIHLFENMLSYGNHLASFSEEISVGGEQLGNTPQAFSHLALISAAFNLDRVTAGIGGV